MKKIVLAILAMFLLVATDATAQIARWGITGGMNVSKIDWKNVDWSNVQNEVEPHAEKGWYAGITGKITIPVVGLGIDGGLVYSQEGIDSGIEDIKTETAHFISIPLHLRYDLEIWGLDEFIIPFAMIGPQFNYAINDLKFEDFEGEDMDGIVKRTNSWRLDMGLGCILFDHLQVHYSYGIPLGEAVEVNKDSNSAEIKYKLGTHHFGVVYYF